MTKCERMRMMKKEKEKDEKGEEGKGRERERKASYCIFLLRRGLDGAEYIRKGSGVVRLAKEHTVGSATVLTRVGSVGTHVA